MTGLQNAAAGVAAGVSSTRGYASGGLGSFGAAWLVVVGVVLLAAVLVVWAFAERRCWFCVGCKSCEPWSTARAVLMAVDPPKPGRHSYAHVYREQVGERVRVVLR